MSWDMPSHVFQKHLDGQKKATNRMNSSPNRNQQPTNGWHSNDTLERTQDKWQTFYQNIDDCSNSVKSFPMRLIFPTSIVVRLHSVRGFSHHGRLAARDEQQHEIMELMMPVVMMTMIMMLDDYYYYCHCCVIPLSIVTLMMVVMEMVVVVLVMLITYTVLQSSARLLLPILSSHGVFNLT